MQYDNQQHHNKGPYNDRLEPLERHNVSRPVSSNHRYSSSNNNHHSHSHNRIKRIVSDLEHRWKVNLTEGVQRRSDPRRLDLNPVPQTTFPR